MPWANVFVRSQNGKVYGLEEDSILASELIQGSDNTPFKDSLPLIPVAFRASILSVELKPVGPNYAKYNDLVSGPTEASEKENKEYVDFRGMLEQDQL